MANEAYIVCENLVKIYKVADLEVVALQGLELEVAAGEVVALIGASGSGKSTLLNILSSFDLPSAGRVTVDGRSLLDLTERQRDRYKQSVVGFVWQQPGRNLLPYLSAVENVELPLTRTHGKRRRALELLDLLGLADQADLRPDQLAGGQQQRVALAVALANEPGLLLADEPTGQLDSAGAHALRLVNRQLGTTILLVTHDPTVAARVDRIISIRDGRTSTEIRRLNPATDGDPADGEEEWVILDRAGRLQIPPIYVEALALRGRVRVRREADHLSLWPADDEVSLPDQLQPPPNTAGQLSALATDLAPLPISGLNEPERSAGQPAIRTEGLTRIFAGGAAPVRAIDELSLAVPHGVLALFKGRSGSGKTTLLNMLGGLDEPTSGRIWLYDLPLTDMTDAERNHLRRHRISYVFQTFGLLPFLTARENVEFALRLLRLDTITRHRRARILLELVGLEGRSNHRVHELSGGEQQRVAIARALAGNPWLILADEPTGQLDTTTGLDIIALLRQVVDALDTTVIIASHDPKIDQAADLIFELRDGQLMETPQY